MNNIQSITQHYNYTHQLYKLLPEIQKLLIKSRAQAGDYKCSCRNDDYSGWLKCDGRLVSTSEFKELFEIVGYSFGGAGAEFRLPDFRGRVMGATGEGAGLTIRTLGQAVGAETHVLTEGEMPSHIHSGVTASNGSHTHTTNATGGNLGLAKADGGNTVVETDASLGELNVWTTPVALSVDSAGGHAHTFTTSNAGSGEAHNNMQPTLFAGNVFIFSGKLDVTVIPE